MFDKVATERLREMSRELAIIGDEETRDAHKYPAFARCLSVLMRIEIAKRDNEDPCREPIPGFDP